jgi:hypothetical protein
MTSTRKITGSYNGVQISGTDAEVAAQIAIIDANNKNLIPSPMLAIPLAQAMISKNTEKI